jgi:hypothetical protein
VADLGAIFPQGFALWIRLGGDPDILISSGPTTSSILSLFLSLSRREKEKAR